MKKNRTLLSLIRKFFFLVYKQAYTEICILMFAALCMLSYAGFAWVSVVIIMIIVILHVTRNTQEQISNIKI
jgi:Ca2+-dependent lipid-binding protein